MKKLMVCVCAITLSTFFMGCVPITYQKSVTTHFDAAGRVTGTDVTETIAEPHQETPRIQQTPGGITFKNMDKQ